ncbi:MAG: hypothetical protein SVK08_05370 [Halobacteriota archaeon]|nr:hypothetical protein [Halobacteriota archaeon]
MNKILTFFIILYLELRRKVMGVKYFAEIDVTDNCNLRCGHCYHFNGKQEFVKEELPFKIWKERLDNLYQEGVRFLLLVGGEPALREDVLMYANELFPMIYVITNGTIVIPKEFNHLLFVSIDGSEERNDMIRGRGIFSKVMKNYSGDNRVAINMTITKENYKDLEGVVKLARENGFRGVVCNICSSGTDVEVPMFLKRSDREIIIEELKRVKRLYPRDFILSDRMIKWYEYADHRGFCHWGDEVLHFDVSWKKRRCFGNNADCSNCGCFAGAIQNPMVLIFSPFEAIRLM